MSSYILLTIILSILVLVGISMMSKVRTAVAGNALSAMAMLAGIIATLIHNDILAGWTIYPMLAIGAGIGLVMARRVKMIEMPQMVALFNGLGGAASAFVGLLTAFLIGFSPKALIDLNASGYVPFVRLTAMLAIAVGTITFVGSLIAAGKLHRVLPQKPVFYPYHSPATIATLIITCCFVVLGMVPGVTDAYTHVLWPILGCFIFSALFGLYFSIRVGGADMPITISLLNSLSGVAGSIAGMAIGDVFLVAVGGIVGASGLLLTQIMCRAMNRSLFSILVGKSAKPTTAKKGTMSTAQQHVSAQIEEQKTESCKAPAQKNAGAVLNAARNVIIVPGYGMALAQAQHQVKQLAEKLESNGAEVRYAIHPVAGRMPGHMNVLLAEADVPYEQLFEMDAINPSFANCDAVIVIGANDVLNPAARDAEGTPIYGMPVLDVDKAPEIIICNFDLKPGYAGVDNPLYTRSAGVFLELGDAKETLRKVMSEMDEDRRAASSSSAPSTELAASKNAGGVLATAHNVIIVPGYGMALAQAQHQVKQLAEKLESNGAEVRYAIHPVAGRMPGHMNVLLAEADVPYEQLFEMDAINPSFANCDAVIVIGANDVLNPAARDAEGTPIYGMPVLNVDMAREIVICNFDLKPGYAGVDNPLYSRSSGVFLELGDAKETLRKVMNEMDEAIRQLKSADAKGSVASTSNQDKPGALNDILAKAKNVIIVPGYGMALAQAQHLVKQLAEKFESNGAEVRYAIHPVAGRMPGHMNVLLAEADVAYEQLFEMDAINDAFAECDLALVVGANDVLNPAARDAEGTPIYGMPVLDVDKAPEIIICNFDLKPGYAGVDNPLYTRLTGVHLELGDAKESLCKLLNMF